MKLQHATRRGPGEFITVGDQTLEIDESGEVEVTEEQAARLLQGTRWKPAGTFAIDVGTSPGPRAAGEGRPVRTKEELAAMAGLPEGEPAPVPSFPPAVPESSENLTNAPASTEKEEAEEEVITVNPGMSRAELAAVALKAGYPVTDGMTKKQILELFTE